MIYYSKRTYLKFNKSFLQNYTFIKLRRLLGTEKDKTHKTNAKIM